MLIVAGTFEVEPARRDEFLRSREEAMRISRGEAGCLAYVFSADPLEPGRVVLYERWEDGDALAAHLAAMRERAASRGDSGQPAVPVLSSEVVRYEVASAEALG